MTIRKQFKDSSHEIPNHSNAEQSVTEKCCSDSLQKNKIYECEGKSGKEGERKIL